MCGVCCGWPGSDGGGCAQHTHPHTVLDHTLSGACVCVLCVCVCVCVRACVRACAHGEQHLPHAHTQSVPFQPHHPPPHTHTADASEERPQEAAAPEGGGPPAEVRVWGNLVAFVERLDDEMFKSQQVREAR
jgi:hypothetical protein